MTINQRAQRRPRRIAADEAHAWARNLRLGNHHAKMVLTSLTLYIDGDGYCYVAIPSLADDCELSPDTVRRRLVWLEEIGAIARLPQWIDEYGRRNGEAKGKRTSDLIRLLLDADDELIEARARGEFVDVSREVSPSSQPGLNPDHQETVSPALALAQPSHCGEGLISEPEPESPPKAPSGGESVEQDQVLEEEEPEHFAPAWAGWPGHEAMRRDLALSEFRQLSPEKQVHCRAAVPLFAQMLTRLGRTRVPNFHLWIRQRGFDEFPNAQLPKPPPERRFVQGRELEALGVATRMASRHIRPVEDTDRGRGIWTMAAEQPDLVALADFAGQDPASWATVELGSPQYAAWRDRLQLWLGGEIEPERIWLEEFDPAVHGLQPMHPDFRFRKSAKVLRVPAPWPPHRDGTWPPIDNDNSEVA
jgi:hypothetical protein